MSSLYEAAKQGLVELLRIPPEPHDPRGSEESQRVFRAAPQYLNYRRLGWLIGTIFGGLFLLFLEIVPLGLMFTGERMLGLGALLVGLILLVLFVAYALISFYLLRLDYEFRWYKVSDRSLRIREGVVFVREMTMTIANIQNVSITQGPVQRLFGIRDLKVESAGGGRGSSVEHKNKGALLDMHTGYFRGINNAEEIRDLIMSRLKRLKDTGLGDLDERRRGSVVAASGSGRGKRLLDAEAFAILRDIQAETAALRRTACTMADSAG